jgi:hypothetical protein
MSDSIENNDIKPVINRIEARIVLRVNNVIDYFSIAKNTHLI